MNKQLLGALAAGLLLSLVCSHSPGQNAGEPLVGEWLLLALEDDGNKVTIDNNAKVVITKAELKLPGMPGCKYTLDSSKNPKTIDLVLDKTKLLGIFELKDDYLQICLGPSDGPRATKFESKAKSENDMWLILKRAP